MLTKKEFFNPRTNTLEFCADFDLGNEGYYRYLKADLMALALERQKNKKYLTFQQHYKSVAKKQYNLEENSEYWNFSLALSEIYWEVQQAFPQNIFNSISEQLKTDIDYLSKIYGSQLSKKSNESTKNIEEIIKSFRKDVLFAIEKYKPIIESHASWKPFIKNILLILTGIGLLFTMWSVSKKLTTGRYGFFDDISINYAKLQNSFPSQVKTPQTTSELLEQEQPIDSGKSITI